MSDDPLKASVRPELVPAGLGDPQPILALVCEIPGALVQAPQASGVGGCGLIEHDEATVRQAAMNVGERLCTDADVLQISDLCSIQSKSLHTLTLQYHSQKA